MKKGFCLLLFCVATLPAVSQEIVNLVMVGKNGVTENIKEAHSFIVIKKYPGGFQRLDYKLKGPLQKLRSYSDSTISIMQGPYYEYTPSGTIAKSGYYEHNLKEKDWYYFNDTGKVILEEKYEKGMLVKTVDPDTVKRESVSDKLKAGEREAVYKNGDSDWKRYLVQKLNAEVGNQSVRGGQVRVCFIVDTSGKCVNVYLRKSVEFVLDEEAIRVIEKSPLWEPAVQFGRKVNAYRIQPITFSKGG